MEQALSWQQQPVQAPDAWLCNIVWGGNELALETFTMPGLDGCLLSVPCANSRAGGDIYHVTVCDHGVFSKFLLVDVAGHGQPDVAARDADDVFEQRLSAVFFLVRLFEDVPQRQVQQVDPAGFDQLL